MDVEVAALILFATLEIGTYLKVSSTVFPIDDSESYYNLTGGPYI